MKKDDDFQLWPFMTLIALFFLMQALLPGPADQSRLSYSEFEKLAREGQVEKVIISGSALTGTFRQPVDGNDRFRTTLDYYVITLESAAPAPPVQPGVWSKVCWIKKTKPTVTMAR